MVNNQIYSNLTVSEASEILKVSEAHVYKAVQDELIVAKRFKVSKYDKPISKVNLPKDLLIEWDRVTRKFKKFYGGAR